MSSKTIDDFLYESGLTADGCLNQMDQYDQDAIMRFGQMIVDHYQNAIGKDYTMYYEQAKDHPHGWYDRRILEAKYIALADLSARLNGKPLYTSISGGGGGYSGPTVGGGGIKNNE